MENSFCSRKQQKHVWLSYRKEFSKQVKKKHIKKIECFVQLTWYCKCINNLKKRSLNNKKEKS